MFIYSLFFQVISSLCVQSYIRRGNICSFFWYGLAVLSGEYTEFTSFVWMRVTFRVTAMLVQFSVCSAAAAAAAKSLQSCPTLCDPTDGSSPGSSIHGISQALWDPMDCSPPGSSIHGISQALWDPMDCSPPGSSVHGILQARILEQVAISSSRGSSRPRDWAHVSCVSCIAGIFFTHWVIREVDTIAMLYKVNTC